MFISKGNEKILQLRNEFFEGVLKSKFNLLGHFSTIEKEVSREYLGREIWELLQNAYQEFNGIKDNAIQFELRDNILSVSNNGNLFPIEKGGIQSLFISHTTEKDDKYLINKGLGFRSLINIADKIRIFSGDISIQYSLDFAEKFFRENGIEENAFILAAPDIIEPKQFSFDTLIELELKEQALTSVQQQLTNIGPETAIFLDKLDFMEIIINGKYKRYDRTSEDDLVTLIEFDGSNRIEHVFFYDHYSDDNYEIMIAYNENIDPKKNYLYSYFQTRELLPIKFLINANFELNQNRNNLSPNSNHNKVLSEIIMKRIFSFAITKINANNWERFNALAPETFTNFGSYFDLNDDHTFSFEFRSELLKIPCIPTAAGEIKTLKDPLFSFSTSMQEYFVGPTFDDLMLQADETIIRRISLLIDEVKSYSFERTVTHLNSVLETWSLEKRVKCAIEFAHEYDYELTHNHESPKFFIDVKKRAISNKNLLTSQKQNTYDYPFLDPRFLDNGMRELFEKVLNIEQGKFHSNPIVKVYGIEEYKMEPLIRNANNNIEKNPDPKWVKLYLNWLFENDYNGEAKYIYCLTRKGRVDISTNLILGADYGYKNNEDLYRGEDVFPAPAKKVLINNEDNKTFSVFMERFVPKAPLVINENIDGEKLNDFWLFNINNVFKYPIKFKNEQKVADRKKMASEAQIFPQPFNSRNVKDLENIIKRASTKSIFELIENNEFLIKESSNYLKAKYFTHNKIFSYFNTNIDFPLYLLRKTKWININGVKYSPTQIILNERVGSLLLPEYIGISRKDLFKMSGYLTIEKFNIVMKRLGIVETFDQLQIDEVYRVLTKLYTEQSDDGIISRMIYKDIMEATGITAPSYSTKYNFIQNGHVYCYDEKGYIPIKDVYYADKLYPKSFLKHFNLIYLDRKKGAKKAKEWFGVSELEIDYHIQENSVKTHPLNEKFKEEYKMLLVAFLAVKWDDIEEQRKVMLRNASITICEAAMVNYRNIQEELEINNYASLENKRRKFYLRIPKTFNEINSIKYDPELKLKIIEMILTSLNLVGISYEYYLQNYFLYPGNILRKQIEAITDKDTYWDLAYEFIYGEKDIILEVIEFNNAEVHRFIEKNFQKYKENLYQKFNNSSDVALHRTYLSEIDKFISFTLSKEELSSANLDVEKLMIQMFPLLNEYSYKQNIDELGLKTKKKLENHFMNDKDILDSFLNLREWDSILRFGHFNYLKEEFEKYLLTIKTKKIDRPIKELKTPVESTDDIKIRTKQEESGAIRGRAGTYDGSKPNDTDSIIVGEEGEKSALKYIRSKYGVEPIWVSSYARKNNSSLDAGDGKGYDMEFVLSGERRLVEVKTTETYPKEIQFTLTKREYDVAVQNMSNYYIYFVYNLKSDQPIIKEIAFSDIFNSLTPTEYSVSLEINKD